MKNVFSRVLTGPVVALLLVTAAGSWAQSPGPKPTVPALLPAPKAPPQLPQVNLGPKSPMAPVEAVATPSISSVVRDDNGTTADIRPGTLLRITGSGLAAPVGVRFSWNGGGADATPDASKPGTDTTLYVQAPQAIFVGSLAVQVTVARGRLSSSALSFGMNPNLQTVELVGGSMLAHLAQSDPGSLVYTGTSPGPSPNGALVMVPNGLEVWHRQTSGSASRGDDTIFPRSNLRPGWIVKSVLVAGVWDANYSVSTPLVAGIVQSGQGTQSLFVKVHWDRGSQSSLVYRLRYRLEGPVGTSPL